jgi:citrate lyase beta subunit
LRTRSFLFTPANRLDRLAKARASGADWCVMDLEDGVAPGEKANARAQVAGHLGSLDAAGRAGLALRVSTLTTADGLRDLTMLLDAPCWPEMLVLPKVESAKEIEQVRSLASHAGHAPAIMVVLETARGIEAAPEILRARAPETVVGYGSADHTSETGGTMSAASLAWARGRIVNACAMAGVPAVDGVCLEFRDMDRLRAEARMVKDMGFAGKIAIHPDQIGPINEVFTASAEEAAQARAMIAAAQEAGGGAFSFHGKMVDGPVLAQAHRTLSAYIEET